MRQLKLKLNVIEEKNKLSYVIFGECGTYSVWSNPQVSIAEAFKSFQEELEKSMSQSYSNQKVEGKK